MTDKFTFDKATNKNRFWVDLAIETSTTNHPRKEQSTVQKSAKVRLSKSTLDGEILPIEAKDIAYQENQALNTAEMGHGGAYTILTQLKTALHDFLVPGATPMVDKDGAVCFESFCKPEFDETALIAAMKEVGFLADKNILAQTSSDFINRVRPATRTSLAPTL